MFGTMERVERCGWLQDGFFFVECINGYFIIDAKLDHKLNKNQFRQTRLSKKRISAIFESIYHGVHNPSV